MGAVVELHHDDRGMIWPRSIAPYLAHLVDLAGDGRADSLYASLTERGIEVLFDDRAEASAGEKFADADLIGCPVRLTIGKKTPEGSVELRDRSDGTEAVVALSDLAERLS